VQEKVFSLERGGGDEEGKKELEGLSLSHEPIYFTFEKIKKPYVLFLVAQKGSWGRSREHDTNPEEEEGHLNKGGEYVDGIGDRGSHVRCIGRDRRVEEMKCRSQLTQGGKREETQTGGGGRAHNC